MSIWCPIVILAIDYSRFVADLDPTNALEKEFAAVEVDKAE